jgi:hypothetical protein
MVLLSEPPASLNWGLRGIGAWTKLASESGPLSGAKVDPAIGELRCRAGDPRGIHEVLTGHRVQRQGAARCSSPRWPLTWVMNRIDTGANIANSVTAHGAGAVLRDSFVSDNE